MVLLHGVADREVFLALDRFCNELRLMAANTTTYVYQHIFELTNVNLLRPFHLTANEFYLTVQLLSLRRYLLKSILNVKQG